MNKMKTRIVLGAAVLLLVTAAAQPARAACSAPTVLGTVEGIGVESQIMTDAFYATAGPSPYYPGQWYSYAGPPVDTGSLVGVWWGLGTGNPASGAGDDNGTFDVSRWLDFYYGQGPSGTFYYGAYLAPGGVTGWSASAEIDATQT